MNTATLPPAIKPDFCVIGIDETAHWSLPARLMEHVERIVTLYGFNRAVTTNCCELTPSYWLEVIGYDAHVGRSTPESVRDEIDEFVRSTPTWEGSSYMHVTAVERLAAAHPKRFTTYGDNDGDQEENCSNLPDWLFERWNSNPRF